DAELDAHAVMARFLAGVADRVAGFDRALTLDHTGAEQDRFEQRRLAALERTDQGYGARSGRTRAIVTVCRHERSPAREPPPPLSCVPPRADDEEAGELWFQTATGEVKRAGIPPLNSPSTLAAGEAEIELAHPGGDVEAGGALDGQRLQRDRVVVAADQHVGAETERQRGFGRGAHIAPGQRTAIAIGVDEHRPDHLAAARHPD